MVARERFLRGVGERNFFPPQKKPLFAKKEVLLFGTGKLIPKPPQGYFLFI
jgi:hypothetical protein